MVYDDFCSLLERAVDERERQPMSASRNNLTYSSSNRGNNLFSDSNNYQQQLQPDETYARNYSARSQLYPIELEEGSDYFGGGFNQRTR